MWNISQEILIVSSITPFYKLWQTEIFHHSEAQTINSGHKHHTTCLVYLHLISKFGPKYPWFVFVKETLLKQALLSEWPNHHIFFSTADIRHDKESTWFFKVLLPRTYVRGLVLGIECGNTTKSSCTLQNICVFCRDPFKPFSIHQVISPRILLKKRLTSLWLQNNTRGIQAGDLHSTEISAIQNCCGMLDRNPNRRLSEGLASSICAFHGVKCI